MSALVTIRTCAYDGERYRMGDACPRCGARHSTADVALENLRVRQTAERMRAASTSLAPLPAQLDLDGNPHEIAPQTRQERLFAPAPSQLAGQTHLSDGQLEGEDQMDEEREARRRETEAAHPVVDESMPGPWEPCEECKGTGKWPDYDGSIIACDSCNGTGRRPA